MRKEQLRDNGLFFLKQLAENKKQKKQREERLSQKLYQTNYWQKAERIGLTLALPYELETRQIISQAWQENKKVFLPRVLSSQEMVFIEYQKDDRLIKSSFGVFEPQKDAIIEKKKLSLIIVPGIIFNQQGYRIGFGGGFYDRYLVDYLGETVSLLFQEQLVEGWPVAPHDQPVSNLIKEH